MRVGDRLSVTRTSTCVAAPMGGAVAHWNTALVTTALLSLRVSTTTSSYIQPTTCGFNIHIAPAGNTMLCSSHVTSTLFHLQKNGRGIVD